ncbi:serine/threonine-protein phosphatase [Paraburkholderia sp. D15]|uniref:PP2C family protein-serine/threonine phosphatase n=1 Tax=Paraburkholderia sp. D15 TaxID=2880218 RepID=UPI002478D0E3|nr:PP2C family serine/threonine-protein phosphatase [Paraburkholderia sp. D15]WGS50113.1 serine/threonine-protein phosphatase [Paraburkholderia sp. D15]
MSTQLQTPAAKLTTWFMRRTAPSAVRRVAPLNAAVASDVGVVRAENQDRVALVRGSDRSGAPFILAVLADGIGGMRHGAECASLTLATFIDTVISEAQHTVEPKDWLRRASLRANRVVHTLQGGDGGSTLAAILLAKGHRAVWLSIGDSRVYHVAEGKMTQLSRDDTLDGQLGKPIDGGRRSELLQFVGVGDALEPHIEFVPWDLSGTLLLTTDGVHFIDADYLGKVAHFAADIGVCARRFMDLAKMLGGPDNASVVALSVDALSADPGAQVESAFEVWDPFGDLCVMFDRGRSYRTNGPSSISANLKAGAPESSPQDTSAAGNPEAEGELPMEERSVGTAAKGKPSRQKSGSRRKAKVKGVKIEGGPEDGHEGEAPQLSIEFPHKKP